MKEKLKINPHLAGWLDKCGDTWAYNYEAYSDEIIKYKVTYKKNESGELSCFWAIDEGVRQYEGKVSVSERNLYIHSKRLDSDEFVLSIFPLPSDYEPYYLWGGAIGTSGAQPALFRVLWTIESLSIPEAQKEFAAFEATRENSLIILDYNPDLLNKAKIKEAEDRRRMKINEKLENNVFLNNMDKK